MLTYLINVTGDLLALAVILGVIFAFVDWFCGDRGKTILRGGLALGLIAAAVRAYITNTRRLVGGWRVGVYGYVAALAALVLLIIALIVWHRAFYHRSQELTRKEKTADTVIPVLIALAVAAFLYGAVPNVYVYPFKFDTGGNGILSTDYLFRLGGYLLGILVAVLAAVSSYKIVSTIANKGRTGLVKGAFYYVMALYALYNFARLMLVLTPRKIINSPKLFRFAAFSNNHAVWYAYAAFACVLLLGVLIWIGSFTARETYRNSAEHRKQRAQWITGKRNSVVALLCCVCAVLCATWFVKLNTEVIREAPVEYPEIVLDEEGQPTIAKVSLDLVVDGHLHRFGYETDEGKLVRFIVVLKQENTSNYGVGLDACEICGEAGYYENSDGAVVCKKCGVIMNKTTIGMKGGCNPIIIDYDISDGYITVPVADLVNNQNHFSS